MKNKSISSLLKLLYLISFVVIISLNSGCTTVGGAGRAPISIGMSKSELALVVGQGNLNLAKKRQRTTANGTTEVIILHDTPFGWSWAHNTLGTPVEVVFEGGKITSISR
jgi:hypothetical protein